LLIQMQLHGRQSRSLSQRCTRSALRGAAAPLRILSPALALAPVFRARRATARM